MTDMPYEATVPVRYSDHDTLGHVNNAAYATFLEEARFSYFLDVLEEPLTDMSMVVAHMELDFHAPVTSRTVDIGVAVTDVGERSFTIEYAVESDGEVAVTASTVQVPIDQETGEAVPVPEQWRAAFTADNPTVEN
ncbi:Acyl-CoA thioesterase FadM [Halanaeroarchaeum sp. HSR-CO]|uniref:acyl-CoA thioesterase n=1 Tax=Halanaeroarchaeum sp. HSR-CO TaxID=2866382 RepID=UPI00217CCE52|nr:thioesterase family protein [Halanaeroarchaeum sp. HSR-CO]UWG48246.1 Acyl-CoA thioesterase FadM [Halanaeroarchaeum sp. HSR-CO]